MLTRLFLENFRNYSRTEFELDKTTVFLGPNGAGKSNILEAISLLSFCRSYREDDKKSLVRIGADYARIQSGNLEVFIQKNPSFLFKAKKDGVFRKQSDFIGSFKTVVFSPETISIISGQPKNRRKFLDIMISQKDRFYLTGLVNYEKIKTERNSLLGQIGEGRSSEDELVFWDQELIREGSILEKSREEAVLFLNSFLSQFYAQISGRTQDELNVELQSNCRNDFSDTIVKHRRAEIGSKRTLIGPHRDDLVFTLNGLNMANFASRGEARSAILALKMAELKYLENGEPPVLLLDDVFSEFDQERRGHLLELIRDYQAVVTTTDLAGAPKDFIKNCKVINLNKLVSNKLVSNKLVSSKQ